MAKIEFDVISNLKPVIEDWNNLNETGVKIKNTVDEIGETSKDAFNEAGKSSNKFADESKKAFDEAKKGSEGLEKNIKNLIAEEEKEIKVIKQANKEIDELNKSKKKAFDDAPVKQFTTQVKKLDTELEKTTTTGKEGFSEMGDEIEGTGGKFGGLLDVAAGFGLALGIGAIIEGVIAVGGAVIETVGEFRTLRGEVQQLTSLTGDSLDTQVAGAKAIAETFDVDVIEVIKAANVVSNEFGITQEEALKKVKEGALGVAGDTGELIEQTKEYSAQIKAAGGNADDLFNIINKSTTSGVFSDKGIDVVKEFGLRIREQTDGTKDALENAFGNEFTDNLLKGINEGSITSVEALEQVSQKLNDTELPAKELQTVIADVFGGAGEDAGVEYLKSLTNISGSVSDLIDDTNVLTREQKANLEANEELAVAQNKLSKLFDDQSGSTFFTDLKTVGFELLIGVIEPFLEFISSIKKSFSPLIDAVSELATEVFGAGESFSLLDVILTPTLFLLDQLSFLLGAGAKAFTFVTKEITKFVKSSPAVTKALDFIKKSFNELVETFNIAKDFITSGFSSTAVEAGKAQREIDKNFTQPLLKSLDTISKAERDREKARLRDHNLQIARNLKIFSDQDKLSTAAAQKLIAQGRANLVVLAEIKKREKAEIDAANKELEAVKKSEEEKLKVKSKASDKDIAAAKKAAEKRAAELKKIQDDFNKALEKLQKDSDKIVLDNLEGPEKFAKIKENNLKEIESLEELIISKGELLAMENGETFQLAQQQIDQLNILRREAEEKELSAIAKFNAEKQKEELGIIGDLGDTTDIQEETEISAVDDLSIEDTDLSIVDFELFKQQEILRIQEEYARRRIDLLQDEIDLKIEIAENDGQITIAEQNEIDKLNLQKQGIEDFVEEAKKGQEELAAQQDKFSLAEFLGVSNENLDKIKQGLNDVLDATIDQISGILDAEAEAANARLEGLEDREDSLKDQLDSEIALSEAGFSSNVEGTRASLDAVRREKEKAQKDSEAIAKRQFLLDTALQTQGLITSSIEIIKGFSSIPIVGLPLGIAAVGAMFAFFANAKAKAFSSIGGGAPQAEKGASGKGSSGTITGKRHYEGGERFTDHLEVEGGEKWGILSRQATDKHGDFYEDFTVGLNQGKSPNELVNDLLFGTGIYVKRGIDKKVNSREMVIKKQEIVMLASETSNQMEESLVSVDKHIEELKLFQMSKKVYIPKEGGRIEIDPLNGKKTTVKYT